MEQIGFVRKIFDNQAEIEVRRVSACGDNCKSCGGGCDAPKHIVTLRNSIDAKAGDLVEIRGETKNLLKYTMIVYMIPFFMLLIGILVGVKVLKKFEISNYEPLSFLIGLVFLAIGYFIVRIIDNNIGKKEDNTITMVRII